MSAQSDFHEEEALGKAYDARLMGRLLEYLKPYWWLAGLAVLLLAGASALEVVGPWLTMVALDRAIPQGDGRLLSILAMGYLSAMLVGFLLQYVQRILTAWLGQRIMYDLRREIFRKLQRLDLRYYDRNPVGRLITRITSDVETLNELFASGIVTVFGDVFTLAFIVAAMLQMDWKLALVAFSVLPFVAWTAFVFRARVRDAYRDIRVRLARINSFLHERFTGIRVVQLFNREETEAREHHRVNMDYLQAHLRSITYYALFFPVIELFTAIALALIIWARRKCDPGRDHHRGRGCGLPSICPEVLPAHPGSIGEVQPSAGCHGLVRTNLQAAGPGHTDRGPRRADSPALPHPGRDRVP